MKRFITAPMALAVATAVVVLAGCSGAGRTSNAASTVAPSLTSRASSNSATSTSLSLRGPAKATRDNPLAERTFRIKPTKTVAPPDAIAALKGYFDQLVTAFAQNKVPDRTRHYTTPRLYQDAKQLIKKQVKGRYVLYGAWVFTLRPRGATANVAVINVCVDQHASRRHDLRTDKTGPRNDTPYVRLDYTLNRLPAMGWVVVGYKGTQVRSCSG